MRRGIRVAGLASAAVVVVGTAGCPPGADLIDTVASANFVDGAAAKGPFTSAGTITVRLVRDDLTPVGDVSAGTIVDDLGRFSVLAALPPEQVVELGIVEVSGVFVEELSGALLGPLELRSLFVPDLLGERAPTVDVNVNVATHLAAARIEALLVGGAGFDDAEDQARNELYATLDVATASTVPQRDLAELTLLGGGADSAWLLWASIVFTQAALGEAGVDDPDAASAAVRERLADLTLDFADDGILQDAADIALTARTLDVDEVQLAAGDTLASAGLTTQAPDVGAIVDEDDDGVAHDDDNCPTVPNASQIDINLNGIGDNCEDEPPLDALCFVDDVAFAGEGIGQTLAGAPDASCIGAPPATPGADVVLEGCIEIVGLGNGAIAGIVVTVFDVDALPDGITTQVALASDAAGLDCAGADADDVACRALSCASEGFYRLSGVTSDVPLTVQVHAPDAADVVIDTWLFDVVVGGAGERALPLVYRSTYDSIPVLAGRRIDGQEVIGDGVGRALIIGRVRDCAGSDVESALVSTSLADAQSAIRFSDGNADPLPDLTRLATNSDGLFFALNVVTTPTPTPVQFAFSDGSCAGDGCSCVSLGSVDVATFPDSVSMVGF